MRVLVACEFSGVVRDAFLRRGHDAYSCDIVAGVGDRHIKGDVTKYLREPWDLVIAHPPCTFLSKVAACRLAHNHPQERTTRLFKMIPAVEFFLACLNANSPKIAVENPIPHNHSLKRIGMKYSQIIQPWQFGHPYTKATCLWLRGLPLLTSTDVVKPTMYFVATDAKQRGRGVKHQKHIYGSGRMRSIFHTGIADAMADQWGCLDTDEKSSNFPFPRPSLWG